jgi:hypothetical protein
MTPRAAESNTHASATPMATPSGLLQEMAWRTGDAY